MKILAMLLLLGPACPSQAGYKEAAAAMKGLGDQQAADLDGWLAQPGDALARSDKATALLADNQPALELFRAAAAEPGDGYLLSPKVEKISVNTPAPKYGEHIRLYKVLLLDAKVKAARGQRAQAEADLLAAAGFLAQCSAQRSFILLTSMTGQLCLQKAAPVIAEVLRGNSASPAFLKEFSARLALQAKNQDFMRAALREEAEMEFNSVKDAVTKEALEAERKKLPFWKRYGAQRLQNDEFIKLVQDKYGAASEARTQALAEAFRNNDPASYDAFFARQQAEAKARKGAFGSRGLLAQLKSLAGGAAAREDLAGFTADTLTEIAVPAYGKLVPRYHAYYCALGVLRAAAALKLYQKEKKKLPAKLDELVPAWLDAVPADTFNKGAPLAYAAEKKKFVVYSLGPDGKDDKGALQLDFKAWSDNPAMSAGDIVYTE